MKHIHVVGSGPRTGTTLMVEAMIACFRVDQYTDHEDRVFVAPPGPGEIYLSKAPKDLLVIKSFLDLDPDLYVICMIRDPRDMIVSKHGLAPDRYWVGLSYWNTYIASWRRTRGHPRFFTVRYEDFVSDPDAAQVELMALMPFLEKTATFSRYHEIATPSERSLLALGIVREIGPDGIGAWRNHLPRIAGQVRIHGSITEDLIEFGYEEDEGWAAVLDGVEPDLSSSHLPERLSRLNLLRRTAPAYWPIMKAKLKRSVRY